jgi:HK97 family phage prohead protease
MGVYGAVFFDPDDSGTEYEMYDDVFERIMPGAFDKALREDDVRGTFNHDSSCLLGRTASGTMRLSVDRRGSGTRSTRRAPPRPGT